MRALRHAKPFDGRRKMKCLSARAVFSSTCDRDARAKANVKPKRHGASLSALRFSARLSPAGRLGRDWLSHNSAIALGTAGGCTAKEQFAPAKPCGPHPFPFSEPNTTCPVSLRSIKEGPMGDWQAFCLATSGQGHTPPRARTLSRAAGRYPRRMIPPVLNRIINQICGTQLATGSVAGAKIVVGLFLSSAPLYRWHCRSQPWWQS